MPKKMKDKGNPEAHSELRGFDIKINEFGQIEGSFEVDKINEFLNRSVEDKKLNERDSRRDSEK